MERLDPKLDLVFKRLLTREPMLLVDMVQGILARPVDELTVLEPGIPGERTTDKQIVLDIRATLDDGSRIDLEMQRRTLSDLAPRLVYYAARDYAAQLRRGDPYHRLTPTAGIVWLIEPLIPGLDRLHSVFELRDRHTGTRLCDHLAIHLLQLSCFSPSRATETGYTASVQRWARFLLAQDDAEFERLAAEDPIMSTATRTLELLSQDPETLRLAREREDSIRLYEMSLAASEARGRTAGKAEGKAELVLKLLGLRFGAVPERTRVRVGAAAPEQLDAWAERVLTAETLDEVFRAVTR